MLVCKDCGRYLNYLYDKCPGCGSTNLTHEETKYSFLVEKTPKEGYLLAKELIDFEFDNPKEIKKGMIKATFLILLFIGVVIFVFFQINNPDDRLTIIVPFIIGMAVVFGFFALILKALPTYKNQIVKLYKNGVLYKNVPYKLEKGIGMAYIVVYIDINGEKNRKFRQLVNTNAQMIEDEGYIDLLVNPKDPLIFFMAEDIY